MSATDTMLLCGLVLALAAMAFLFFSNRSQRLLDSVLHMGHMRTFGPLGYEWWGEMRPFAMWTREGHCFKPLVGGLWWRCKKLDRQKVAREGEEE